MPHPRSVEDLTADLLELYERSWQRITLAEQQLINRWVGWRRVERFARLRELRVMVERLMDTADEQALLFTQQQLPQAYLIGSAAAGTGFTGFAQPDLDAIGVLARDTYGGLLEATTFVRESTKDLIRTLGRQHAADRLVRGVTAQQAAADLVESLQGRGIAAVVYKNGARHGLADYSDMLLRTKTAEAYTIGTFNQLEAAGVTFVELLDGVGCGLTSHDDPDKANGTIRTLEEARAFPISHPRCRRAVLGRPDVRSARDARRARPSVSPEQQADQAEAEARRALGVAARASQRSFERAVQRRTDALLSDAGSRVRSVAQARTLARRQATLARRQRRLARSG